MQSPTHCNGNEDADDNANQGVNRVVNRGFQPAVDTCTVFETRIACNRHVIDGGNVSGPAVVVVVLVAVAAEVYWRKLRLKANSESSLSYARFRR